MKPIVIGQVGAAVEDVQRRLNSLGYSLGTKGIDGVYAEDTAAAVRDFRAAEGLPINDTVDADCWAALVDATFELGDRSLFLKLPYFHGCDIKDLQQALNVLGFTCGIVDGIFGAHTERALREFQANVGIDPDGIAGSLTFDAIQRLQHVWKGKDATPHSAATIGFSRAAAVLEQTEICVFGTSACACQIASRISNLALATTQDSRVTSAESIKGAPSQTMLLIQIALTPSKGTKGIPLVAFSDDGALAPRLQTAAKTVISVPRRIEISIPDAYFADPTNSTPREQQHIAVTLLDAFCVAFA